MRKSCSREFRIFQPLRHVCSTFWTLRACLEVLAGQRSYSYTLDRRPGPPLSGMVVLFDRARSFGRDAHGAVREEGDTHLANQISRINPGDQWGDRCRNQIALTSSSTFWVRDTETKRWMCIHPLAMLTERRADPFDLHKDLHIFPNLMIHKYFSRFSGSFWIIFTWRGCWFLL